MTLTSLKTPQKSSEPRLKPIENPKYLKLKLAYWYTKIQVGKVITPMKVTYARYPEAFGLINKITQTEQKIPIDAKLKHLIKVYVATINGCAFCIDIGKAAAEKDKQDQSIFDDLLRFEESSKFKPSEKAALAYVDETTRNKHINDATFERLQEYFNEKEIVQITFLNAIENFYNLMNVPLNIGSDELCELIR